MGFISARNLYKHYTLYNKRNKAKNTTSEQQNLEEKGTTEYTSGYNQFCEIPAHPLDENW